LMASWVYFRLQHALLITKPGEMFAISIFKDC
jgi:hypothetical protein